MWRLDWSTGALNIMTRCVESKISLERFFKLSRFSRGCGSAGTVKAKSSFTSFWSNLHNNRQTAARRPQRPNWLVTLKHIVPFTELQLNLRVSLNAYRSPEQWTRTSVMSSLFLLRVGTVVVLRKLRPRRFTLQRWLLKPASVLKQRRDVNVLRSQ